MTRLRLLKIPLQTLVNSLTKKAVGFRVALVKQVFTVQVIVALL